MASKSTLLLVLAICACTHAGQLSSESLSTEDYPPTAAFRVDPSDPLRVDIVCEAMCVARCLADNSTVPERRIGCDSLCKNNSTWPMDKCASTVHPSFIHNATQQPEWPMDKPVISEVTLVGNRTVLRWEFKNCTNCPTDNIVAIVRYSRDLKKWNYSSIVVKTANQTISLSLQPACAKYFQIGLVNEFGISPLSEMKTMGPVQVIKDQVQVVNVSVIMVELSRFINLQLSWQFTSELFQDAVIFLDVVQPNCAGEWVDPLIPCQSLANNSVTNNREVTLSEALARGNFHVLHKLHGTLWGCYDMQPVFFDYTYECSKILQPTECSSTPQTSSLDSSTVHTTNHYRGHYWDVLVEWKAIKPHPSEVVYGYAVQWGKLLDKALWTKGPLMPELESETVGEFNIPGVENNSYWLRELEPGEYGVRVFVNTSGVSIDFDMVATKEFTVEAIEVTSPRSSFESSSSSATVNMIIVGIISFASVFLIVCLFLTLRVCRRHYRKSRMSKGGLHLNEQSMANVYSITPAADSPEPPIPDRWEIPFERLEMGDMIGKGQFGIVMKAVIAGKLPTQYVSGSSLFRESLKRHNVQVAVKMLHGDVDDNQKQEFRHEMKLMKDIGYHSNLVSLLGCCCVDATPLCLIVEHCCYGDLLQYLRAHRGLMVRNEKGEKQDDVKADALTPNDLLSFARQIARGMEYLSQKGFVHRDLAARNVMVAEDKTVKIGDFGLTRYVFDDSIYVHRRGGKLPIKWMSVEALFDQVFTIWNDVWSFGVLLFELVTLGASPYPGIHNKDIPSMLKSGDRMQRPENCSEVLYAIMIACWHPCPEERPTFTHLRNKLEALLEENTPYLDLEFCQNYSHYPFFEISEEPESDQEMAGEGEGEESGNRSDVIPLVATDESLGDELAVEELPTEDLALDLETCQPMLEMTMSESRQDEKAFGRELQKKDSGLGSDYLCGSRHTNMEDIPLM